MDGDLAPLDVLCNLMDRPGDLLYLDDAHGTGVVGPGGRGTDAHFGIRDERLVVMGTLSKALGGLGAFVVGPKDLIDVLRSQARSFLFTTALPPPACAASLAVLDILEQEGDMLSCKLWKKSRKISDGLNGIGFRSDPKTPIFPLILGPVERALKVADGLNRAGIFAPAIRPPTVPADECRIRLSLMATHTEEQIDRLLTVLSEVV